MPDAAPLIQDASLRENLADTCASLFHTPGVCSLLANGLRSHMPLIFFDDLRQCRLRCGQPEGHLQGTV